MLRLLWIHLQQGFDPKINMCFRLNSPVEHKRAFPSLKTYEIHKPIAKKRTFPCPTMIKSWKQWSESETLHCYNNIRPDRVPRHTADVNAEQLKPNMTTPPWVMHSTSEPVHFLSSVTLTCCRCSSAPPQTSARPWAVWATSHVCHDPSCRGHFWSAGWPLGCTT